MAAATEPRHSHAFGLDLQATFELDGLRAGRPLGARDVPTRLELTTDGDPGARSRPEAAGDDWSLEHDEELGYRLATSRFGAFAISPDGRRIECAPPGGNGRAWQHCLRGQVLPFAAVLRGLETFHASAVALDHRAVGFVGASKAGKTSVALNLVRRGAGLLTDDVLAVDIRGGRPFAYPGAGVVSLRHDEDAAMRRRHDRPEMGAELESDGEASRTLMTRYESPAPLSVLYFLERVGTGATRFERIDAPDPRLLLAASFNFVVRTPERMRTQLSVCACLASRTPMFWVRIGPETDAAGVARAVEEHASG